MMGLGLYGGPLAVVVFPDPDRLDERPGGFVRMGHALGLSVVNNRWAPDADYVEDHAVQWAEMYPHDLVMIVEVLA